MGDRPPLPPIEVDAIAKHAVVAYHLRFKPFGWAIFSIDDATGTLSVTSDWGSWSHRWGRGSWLGVPSNDLSEALRVRLSAHYLCDKLFDYNARFAFDPHATASKLKAEILESRRGDWIDATEARWKWDELTRVAGAAHQEEWGEVLTALGYEEPWLLFEFSPTTSYRVMLEQVMPAFLAALRGGFLGEPGVRDPQSPCPLFKPGTPMGSCQGDGHHLCTGCTEREPVRA